MCIRDRLGVFGYAVVGEAGPTVRNISRVADAIGDLTQGETERAVAKFAGVTPGVGPFTGARYGIADAFHGENPIPDVDVPSQNEIRNYLLNR